MSETIPPPKTDSVAFNMLRAMYDEKERELAAARAEVEALREFALYYARCPCCQQEVTCVGDCTFVTDDPSAAEEMDQARAALAKEKA